MQIEKAVASVLQRTSAQAEKAGIQIQTDIQPNLTLQANTERMEELIENLTNNAIAYGKPGGHVIISAREERGFVTIRVADDGIGIPPESIPRIFERFYRVDKGRSREKGGTGLGLSIVKHIASLYHGDVSVESRVDEGSVFTVRFPLLPQ